MSIEPTNQAPEAPKPSNLTEADKAFLAKWLQPQIDLLNKISSRLGWILFWIFLSVVFTGCTVLLSTFRTR